MVKVEERNEEYLKYETKIEEFNAQKIKLEPRRKYENKTDKKKFFYPVRPKGS